MLKKLELKGMTKDTACLKIRTPFFPMIYN